MKRQSQFQLKIVAAAVALAGAGSVLAAEGSAADLQKKVDELQRAVDSLRQQVGKGGSVAATGNPEDAVVTRGDLDGLRADLENYKYAQQRDRERKTAITARGTTLFGTLQTRATWQSTRTTATTSAPADDRHSSFDIPLAQFGAQGSLFRDYSEGRNLDYRLLFGYQPNVQSGLTTTNGSGVSTAAASGSQFNLLDAYLNYNVLPTVTGLEENRLSLRFGQQLIPYGLDAQVGDDLRPTINAAQFLGGGAIVKSGGVPVGVNGHGVGARQIGFIVRGDVEPYVDYTANYRAPLFEYNLGIVNGSGPNKSDDNGEKDIIGRVAFTLPVDYNSWLRELKLGSSVYKGQRNLTAASTVGGTTQNFARVGKNERYGFDVYYNHNPFGATYEYSRGKDDAVADGTLAISSIKSKGQYLTFFGQWGEQFLSSVKSAGKFDDWWPKSYQIFLRFDRFDPNVDLNRNETWVTAAGLNVFFAETTKFQVNLVRTDSRVLASKDSNALLAQFQYGF